jgi:hypothetical protein
MTWSSPDLHVWTTGEVVSATNMNTYIRDDLDYLYGDTGWTNVTSFTNSWGNYTGFVTRYMMVGRLVVIEGIVSGGTVGAGTPVFTLPSPYLPSQSIHVAQIGNNAFADVSISSAGVVAVVVGSSTWTALDCVFSTV